jgi:hypothetical protein
MPGNIRRALVIAEKRPLRENTSWKRLRRLRAAPVAKERTREGIYLPSPSSTSGGKSSLLDTSRSLSEVISYVKEFWWILQHHIKQIFHEVDLDIFLLSLYKQLLGFFKPRLVDFP